MNAKEKELVLNYIELDVQLGLLEVVLDDYLETDEELKSTRAKKDPAKNIEKALETLGKIKRMSDEKLKIQDELMHLISDEG